MEGVISMPYHVHIVICLIPCFLNIEENPEAFPPPKKKLLGQINTYLSTVFDNVKLKNK